jgi:hypothetical protein
MQPAATLKTAYASEGAKQFKWSLDRSTGQYRGLNECATMLFSDPERKVWFCVIPWRVEEGEVVSVGIPAETFAVTWAVAGAHQKAA